MKSRALIAALAALAFSTATACGLDSGGGSDGAGGGASTTISVGFDSPQAYTNNMPVLLAIQEGYFAQRGLDVQTVGFNAGSDALKALIARSIQVQAGVGFDVVSGQAVGQPVQAFFGIAQDTDFGLFVLNDSPITSFADLEGKSIAISAFGSYTDYLSKAVAQKEGLTDLKEVPLHQTPAIVGALLSRSVDAAWEPMALAPLFEGKARVLDVSSIGLASQYSTLLATESYLTDNAAAMNEFVAAIKDAIAYHQSHRAESIQLAVEKLGVPQASAEAGYDAASKIYTADGSISQEGLAAMAAAVPSLELGPTAPDPTRMINTMVGS